MGFWSFLDAVLAPADADIATSEQADMLSTMPSMTYTAEPGWHNAFGTQADHQVPAEADSLFQSNDWSTYDGCGFGSGSTSFDSDW